MELSNHSLSELFAQLGLPNEDADIEAFVVAHGPLPERTSLAEAPFWSSVQSRFLHDEIIEDADWAPVIDQLNVMLHR